LDDPCVLDSDHVRADASRFSTGAADERARAGSYGEPRSRSLSGSLQSYTGVSYGLISRRGEAPVVWLCRRLVVTRRSPFVIDLSAPDRAALEQRARRVHQRAS
jgi:hypothetical protein